MRARAEKDLSSLASFFGVRALSRKNKKRGIAAATCFSCSLAAAAEVDGKTAAALKNSTLVAERGAASPFYSLSFSTVPLGRV